MCCSKRCYKVYYALEKSVSPKITCVIVFDETRDTVVLKYIIACEYVLSIEHDGENLIYPNEHDIMALEVRTHSLEYHLVTNWIHHDRHRAPDFGY